jgi:hypothetical protein
VRVGSDTLRKVLAAGGFDHRYVADIYYAGERRLPDVPITDPKLDERGDAKIQQSGSATIVWTDDYGKSVTPRDISDVFAPFGSELYLFSVISVGTRFEERVPLGQYQITRVPSAYDEQQQFRGEWITTGSVVELEFMERLSGVAEDRFDVPRAVTSLDSGWDELGRLTSLQLVRSVPDQPIKRTVAYEEDRLDATYELSDIILDGIPHMTADGALSLRPKTWPPPVDTLQSGENGTLVSVGHAMTPEGRYNRVAFRGKSNDMEVILAAVEITDGPLRARNPDGTRSPFGRRTKFVASDFITTNAQAFEYVDRELPRVAAQNIVRRPVTELFNPLRERGDVIRVKRATESFLARVVDISRDSSATQGLEVDALNV